MPRFTKEEKRRIENTLLHEGKILFATYGVLKVTIDDITKATGISHGAFYTFYSSKEHLFMEINVDCQNVIFNSIDSLIEKHGNLEAQSLVKILLLHLLNEFCNNPIISQMTPQLWQKIERKIPLESQEKNNSLDAYIVKKLLAEGIIIRNDIEITVKTLQATFLTLSNLKDDPTSYRVTDIILDGIIPQLFV